MWSRYSKPGSGSCTTRIASTFCRGSAKESVDLLFADPPFNLGKDYGNCVSDSLKDGEYLRWCEQWITEGVRVLKPGGAFFLWNLPRWNIELGHRLNEAGMMLRHPWVR